MSEQAVTNSAFELIFAFDEVISLGNKEKLNIGQVKQLLVMDSQEERIAEAEQRNKEREAAENAERRRLELERRRAEEARRPGGYSSSYGVGAPLGSMSSMSSSSMGSMGGNRSDFSSKPTKPAAPASSGPVRKGLSLTATAPKANDYMATLQQELGPASSSEMKEMMRQSANPSPSPSTTPAAAYMPPASMRDDVHIAISEKILVSIDKDGIIQQFEVRGELDVFIAKEQYGQVNIGLRPSALQQGLDWKVHPMFNKPAFMEQGSIQMRDANKSFLVNAANGALKWRLLSKDTKRLPLLVTCWPAQGGIVNMEYEARKGLELHDVLVKIPIVAKSQPNISACNGETNFDTKDSILNWSIPLIDNSNTSGNLDFELEQWREHDIPNVFPIQVKFTATTSICDIAVNKVTLGDQPVKFSSHSVVSVETYTIE